MTWVNQHIDQYYQWLKDRTIVHEDTRGEWCVINTPFLGAFNDGIDIYAKKNNDSILLSDNGETLSNLELQGLNVLQSKTKRELLSNILFSYGVKLEGEDLVVRSNVQNFAQSKHNLISSILEINDFYFLSKHIVSSSFTEDVRSFLDELEITYTPDFISRGTTGLEFNFDFQIAKKSEEIVIKSFNSINKNNLSNFLFSWEDIKPIREKATKKNVKAIAFINDIKIVKNEYLEALKSKNAIFILWNERNFSHNQDLLRA